MEKPIKLTVNGQDIAFNVSVDAYNAYVNEMMPNNKVAPSHNFLMRTVAGENREALTEVLKLPGAPIELAGAVVEAYRPELSITVKK